MAVRRGSHHSDLLVNWQEVTLIRLYYKLFQLALYFSVIYNIRATSEPCLAIRLNVNKSLSFLLTTHADKCLLIVLIFQLRNIKHFPC